MAQGALPTRVDSWSVKGQKADSQLSTPLYAAGPILTVALALLTLLTALLPLALIIVSLSIWEH